MSYSTPVKEGYLLTPKDFAMISLVMRGNAKLISTLGATKVGQ